ncbi:MAG TPA: ATP-binding protein [Bacillota bacterium]|nr:ATP-binding protein [Bacillota bacterium]
MHREPCSPRFHEYATRIYEKDSNKFLIKVVWALVFIQVPVGISFSLLGLVLASPFTFIRNALLLSVINLVNSYILKKKQDLKATKYVIFTLLLIYTGVAQYTYINDIAIQMIWLFPVLLTMLYNERALVIYTILGSVTGLVTVDILAPPIAEHYVDLLITDFFLLSVLFLAFFLLSAHIKKIKSGADNSASAVVSGTSIINHALKNEIVKVGLCITNIENIVGKNQAVDTNLTIIDESVDHLMELIRKIQGKIQPINLEKTPQDLADLLDECLLSNSPVFQNKRITVEKNYSPGLPINCDPVHLKEVFNNIIINAIEASDDQGTGILKVEALPKKNELFVIFTDNGSGISKEVLPRVIDPFFSTKPERSKNYGLGLTYCYNVMKEHQGRIDIESEQNKGTKVVLRFLKGK